MKLNAGRLRIVLIVVIMLVILGGGIGSYVALGVVGEQIRATNHTKIDADITANAGQSAAAAKAELEKPEVAQLLKYADSIIPSADYRRQFLADVKKYADDTGVPLSGVTFKDAATPTGGAASPAPAAPAAVVGQAIPITLAFGPGASYESFIAFTKKLENNLQHIQVTSMSLQPEASNGSLLASATLDIQLFVEK